MLGKYHKIIKYVLSGGTAVLVNLAVLYVMVEFLHLWYLLGAIVSFVFGLCTSYTLQKFWTFKDGNTQNIHIQFLSFALFALLMLGLNTLLIYFFVDVLKIWYLLAQAMSSLLIAFINYNVFNKIIFKN
jgi:putative flippase GtrA